MAYPSLPVDEYRDKLKQTVAFPRFQTILDDPNTPQDERRTHCNYFVRNVVRWFNFLEWKPSHNEAGWIDGERAAGIYQWMRGHPDRWRPLITVSGRPDYLYARDKAMQGCCVVAAQVYKPPAGADPGRWQASGHVCVVAPEELMHASGTFGCHVPMVANVGGKENKYGIPLSNAFKPPIDGLYLLVA